MKNKQITIILIIITLVIVGVVSVFLILKTAEKCGNEKCGLGENWEKGSTAKTMPGGFK